MNYIFFLNKIIGINEKIVNITFNNNSQFLISTFIILYHKI